LPDFQAIVDAVSTVGFPIVVALLLLFVIYTMINNSLQKIENTLQSVLKVNIETAKTIETLQEVVLYLLKNHMGKDDSE